MTPDKQIDSHIAREEVPPRTPGNQGGVPDDMDVGKTAPPQPQEGWIDTGGAYGGLRQKVDRKDKPAQD